jgi:hypothetical protein
MQNGAVAVSGVTPAQAAALAKAEAEESSAVLSFPVKADEQNPN